MAPTVLLYDYAVHGKVADGGVQLSIAFIVLGTIVAGWETLNDDLVGYAITMFNNILSAAGSIRQKQFSDTYKPSTFGLVYINACIAAPLTLMGALLWNEFPRFFAFSGLDNPAFWFGFIVSSLMGILLTYSSLLCTTYNSPLATSVTGNVKDIATTAIGWMAFKGFKATVASVSGLMISFIGAFTYSYVNLQKANKNAAAAEGKQHTTGNDSIAASVAEGKPLLADTRSASGAAAPADNGNGGDMPNTPRSPAVLRSVASSADLESGLRQLSTMTHSHSQVEIEDGSRSTALKRA